LVTAGADVNTQNRAGKTPLHLVCRRGNFSHAQTSLGYEAPRRGVAAELENDEKQTITTLIDHGVGFNAQDMEGTVPLMEAAVAGYYWICQVLLEAGADINLVKNEGETALILACKVHKTQSNLVVSTLVSEGKVNAEIYDRRSKSAYDYGERWWGRRVLTKMLGLPQNYRNDSDGGDFRKTCLMPSSLVFILF
jgi:hypothetical protein